MGVVESTAKKARKKINNRTDSLPSSDVDTSDVEEETTHLLQDESSNLETVVVTQEMTMMEEVEGVDEVGDKMFVL